MDIFQSGDVSIKIRNKKSIRRVKVLLNDGELGTLKHYKQKEHMNFDGVESSHKHMDDIVKVVRDFSLYSGKTVDFGFYYKDFKIVNNVHTTIKGKDYYLPFTGKELQELYNKNGKPFTIFNNESRCFFENYDVFLHSNAPFVIKTTYKFDTRIFVTSNEDNICDLSKSSIVITTGKGLKESPNRRIKFYNSDIDEWGEKRNINGKNLSTLKFPKISVDGCERYRYIGGGFIISFDKNLIPDVNSFRALINDLKDNDYPLSFKFDVPDILFYVWNLLNEDEDCYLDNEKKESDFREEYIYKEVYEAPIDYVKRVIGDMDIRDYVDTMIEIHNIIDEYYKSSTRYSNKPPHRENKKSLAEYNTYKSSEAFLNMFK